MPVDAPPLTALQNIATRLRIASVRATSESGSGHPSSCCSAADLVAALFFAEMRFDPMNPQHDDNDRFVLSKGHAAPLLYAAWAETGAVAREDLLTLRKLSSDLEGHPTPRLPFVDVPTGSLGQGICAAIGAGAQRAPDRVGLPDIRAGRRWRGCRGLCLGAAQAGQNFALDNLCGIVDVNALGQSAPRSSDTTSRRLRPAGARSAGTPSSSTGMTWRPSSKRSRRPAGRRADRP